MKRRYLWAVAAVLMILIGENRARGAAPVGRYMTTTTTVFDTKTGLTWQRATPMSMSTWQAATTYCAGVSASLGGTGWRLPTVKELATIVDDTVAGPTIDPTFTSTPISLFWSSTLLVTASSSAWIVSFGNGNVYPNDMSVQNAVRCVH